MHPPSNSDTILVAARTVKGLREENQDALTSFLSPFGFVYLVADGMGGTQGGSTASNMTTECYRKYLTSLPPALPNPEALQRATAATNAEIRLRSQSGDPAVAGMGSTVVMAIFANTETGLRGTIAHIGDSRAYLLRRGTFSRLTRDHSTVQRLIDSHQITEQEARTHPDASVITRALGPQDEVQIEVSEHTFEPGDILLLCSDGLSGYVEDHAIAAELAQPRDLVATAEALVALATASGSSDNITVQVLKVAPPNTAGRMQPPLQRPPSAPSTSRSLSPAQERTSSQRSLMSHIVALIAGLVLGLLLAAPLKSLVGHKGTKLDDAKSSAKGAGSAAKSEQGDGNGTKRQIDPVDNSGKKGQGKSDTPEQTQQPPKAKPISDAGTRKPRASVEPMSRKIEIVIQSRPPQAEMKTSESTAPAPKPTGMPEQDSTEPPT